MFNFQEPARKSHFGTSSTETVFHFLKKPVGNEYIEVPRILAPPEILVLQTFLHNSRGSANVQLNIFPDPIHKKGFDIYDPVTVDNFPKKLAKNKYIWVGSYNLTSLLDISCPLHFRKVLEILLK